METATKAEAEREKLQALVQIFKTKLDRKEQEISSVTTWLQSTQQDMCQGSVSAASDQSEWVTESMPVDSRELSSKFSDLRTILSGETPQGNTQQSTAPEQKQGNRSLVNFGHIKEFLNDNQKDLYLFGDVFNGL